MHKKVISNGFIVMAGDLYNGQLISNAEYQLIVNAYENRPTAPSGYAYKLRADDLEWELVELPPIEPEPLTEEEALTRYANTLTGANDTDLISAAETLITDRIKEGTV